MQHSAFRHHGTKIIDYAIRATFVCLVLIPMFFFLSMSGGLGTEPPDRANIVFSNLTFVAIAPAYYLVEFLDLMGVRWVLIAWVLSFIIIPLFWGAVAYSVVHLSGWFGSAARKRLTKRCSEPPTGEKIST